jgi:ubiquitin-protein ligase
LRTSRYAEPQATTLTRQLRDDDLFVWSISLLVLNRDSHYDGAFFKVSLHAARPR